MDKFRSVGRVAPGLMPYNLDMDSMHFLQMAYDVFIEVQQANLQAAANRGIR